MELPLSAPSPTAVLAALAAFVRDRLGSVTGNVSDFPDAVSLVVVGAAGTFAPTSYSRARLARQMHASGLLAGNGPQPADTRRESEGPKPRVLA
jgi:hypothetical protein